MTKGPKSKKNFVKFLFIYLCITFIFQLFYLNLSLAKEFKFDIRTYGFNVMDITYNVDEKKNNNIYFNMESVGIVGFFVKVFSKASVEYGSNKNIWNYSYFYEKPSSKKSRTTNVKFSNQKVIERSTIPPLTSDTRIVSYKKTDFEGVVDPVTAVKKLFYLEKQNFNCNNTIKTFDGIRFFNLVMKDDKETLDFDTTFSKFKGKLNKCSITYQPISGHVPGDKDSPDRFRVEVYFGNVGDHFFPVYATTKGKKDVRLKMYLTSID